MQPVNPVEPVTSIQSVRSANVRSFAILFVRSADDVVSSVRLVNRLLSLRGMSNGDVIAVVVGRARDSALLEPCADLVAAHDVGLREAVGVPGIWSLAWYDLSDVEAREERWAARLRLLDVVARTHAETLGRAPRWTFFPVLANDERPASESLVEWMKARYPALGLIRTIFVDEPSMGGIVRLEGAGGQPD
jgi:hypothetical protein